MLGHLGAMLGHLGAMLTHFGPILGASVGSSWGTFCAICVDTEPITQEIPNMHVRAARITDTTLVKPTVLHFATLQILGLPHPQHPENTMFLNTTNANHTGTAAETHQHQPAPGRTPELLEKTISWWTIG